MYKLLIVEDEVWVRRGLVSKIQQMNFGFSWIGEATNGAEALQAMECEKPDIVITDIRMRHMDGLELIRTGSACYPGVRFIIISGYAEFEYAEQAINMGVYGYLLKPVKDRNIEETLKKVISGLEEERENKQIQNNKVLLQVQHDELVLQNEVNKLFHSFEKNVVSEPTPTEWSGFDMNKFYMLALVHIDKASYSQSDFTYQDNDLIKFSIRNIGNDLCQNLKLGFIAVNNLMDSNQVFLLLMHEDEQYLADVGSRFLMEFYGKVRKFLYLSVTLAVSDIEKGLAGSLYRKTREAFEMRMVHGENQIYRYESSKTGKKAALPEQKFKVLRKCIELYDFKNVEAILREIFSQDSMKDAFGGYIRMAYFETVNTLLGVCSRMGIDPGDYFYTEVATGQVMDSFEKASDIISYLNTSIMAALKGGNTAVQDCKALVGKVIEYLEQNYAEDISFKDLAFRFSMNSSYFSTVFKQEMGVTITKYLMDLRIRKACELLEQTQLSTSDVARCVGYQDNQYFYRVFKKATGKTPLEYRNGE